ncbi:MAG: leucine-rich repeat domain-containing protein [Treponema sp.]|nr:leucine-rich repeat domain-containing protein [Treponema sp.]
MKRYGMLLGSIIGLLGILASCSSTKSLVIKPGTTVIKDNAYFEKKYTSVEIPEGVTTIGDKAFAINNLRFVVIPETVTRIGNLAFFANTNLRFVYVPESVTEIGESAFGDGDVVVVMGKDLPGEYYGDYKAVVQNNKAVITRYRGRERDLVIPGEINGAPVVSIDKYAFMHKSLTSVTIPATVTSIGEGAFVQNAFTGVIIPGTVTAIGDHAFYNNQLTAVDIPASIKTIGRETFADNQIASVTLAPGLTSIGDGAFDNNQLGSVTIPGTVTAIGDRAFYNNQLTAVDIPASVKTIGKKTFAANQIASVTLAPGLTSIGDEAFNNNQIGSVTIPQGVTYLSGFNQNKLTEITIPDSVTEIGNYAFAANALTSVVIPRGVTRIGKNAFVNNQLTGVALPEGLREIGERAFRGNAKITEVTLPSSVVSFKDAFGDDTVVRSVNLATVEVGRAYGAGKISIRGSGKKIQFIPSGQPGQLPLDITVMDDMAYGSMDISITVKYTFQAGHSYDLELLSKSPGIPNAHILLRLTDKTDKSTYHWLYVSGPNDGFFNSGGIRTAGNTAIILRESGEGPGKLP